MRTLHRALAIDGATTHLRLKRGQDTVTLRVFSDPRGARRAYTHAGGFGIAHVEPVIPKSLVPAITGLRAALERGLEHTAWTDESTALEVLRATFDDQRVPHWPPSMRSGAGGEALWPFDAELEGMRRGLRRLIRREWLASDEARGGDERWLASNDLTCRAIPAEGDRVVVLASNDPSALEAAVALEPHVERPSPRWEEAASQMGALLGYPPCCVRTFVAARARNDASLFAERLPPSLHAPLPPEMLWLDGALTLISHAPCDPSCPASFSIASAVRGSLGSGASTWAELAGRLHAITRSGRMLAIAARGTLAEGLEVIDALEIAPNGRAPGIRATAVAPRLMLDGLMLEGLGEPCTLFSDHRARSEDGASIERAPRE
jgi:hypothetical protein